MDILVLGMHMLIAVWCMELFFVCVGFSLAYASAEVHRRSGKALREAALYPPDRRSLPTGIEVEN